MLLKRTAGLALWLCISMGMAACDSNRSTPLAPIAEPSAPAPAGPFLVSNAMGAASVTAGAIAVEAMGATFVYVSLPPGAIDGGTAARIQSVRGGTQFVNFVNGGFDPIPVIASIGDVITVDVYLNGSGIPVAYSMTVPAVSRPTLVRTNPPKHKRDVPLNAHPIVIFSEPVDASSLTSQAIRVQKNGVLVAGTLSFGDPSRTSVTFVPANQLDLNSDYEFVITPDVHNSHGAGLDSTIVVPFTTASVTPAAAGRMTLLTSKPSDGEREVSIYYPSLELSFNEPVDFGSVREGAAGRRITLLSGKDTIAGEVRCAGVNYGMCTSVQFVPSQVLTGATDFQLVVSAGLTGESGAVLSADTTVRFTTFASPPVGLAADLRITSFKMIEFQYPNSGGWYYYAPLVVIAELSGLGSVTVDRIGFDFSSLGEGGFPAYCPGGLVLGPRGGLDMFTEIYGDYQLVYFGSGRAGAGSTATATVSYHDTKGVRGLATATVPITPGQLPLTYTGGNPPTSYNSCN